MSATPRTDEQVLAYRAEDGSEVVHASFAAELETELIAMTARAELAEASAKLWEADALLYANNSEYWKARAEKAEADTTRLDWLSVSDVWLDVPTTEAFTPETIRAAIDKAMKEASK